MEILLLSLIVFLDIIKTGASFTCYSCTYTQSSDPSKDYECVTSPQNFTVGQVTMPCTAPYMCVTKTLYNEDMTQIRSLTRSCQPQHDICKGEKCCIGAGVYPSCEYKCRDDLCNDNNPEEHFGWNEVSDDDKNVGDGDGSEHTILLHRWLYLLACVPFLFKQH